MWVMSLGWLAGSLALVLFNVYIIRVMGSVLGFLHHDTMTQVHPRPPFHPPFLWPSALPLQLLTGMKPLQTTVNTGAFLVSVGAHKEMLRSLAASEALMAGRLGCRPPYAAYARTLRALVALTLLAVLALRATQSIPPSPLPVPLELCYVCYVCYVQLRAGGGGPW